MKPYYITDDPVIRNLERTGYPDGKPPSGPHCPICGARCHTCYIGYHGNVVGCNECVGTADAEDCDDCFPDK